MWHDTFIAVHAVAGTLALAAGVAAESHKGGRASVVDLTAVRASKLYPDVVDEGLEQEGGAPSRIAEVCSPVAAGGEEYA